MSGRRVIPYQTYQNYHNRKNARVLAARRKQRQSRRKRRIFMCLLFIICCVICFLWGFRCRGAKNIAQAGSQIDSIEAAADRKYYTSIVLETGDSLYDIACEYMTEEYDSIDQYITELKQINGMGSNQLQQGDYLLVPYYL